MNGYKLGDLVRIIGEGNTLFKIVMISKAKTNLMLVRNGTNELWSAHIDDLTN
jgi:hypothetical protein